MLKKILKSAKKWNPSYLLAVLFLAYIFCTGYYAFPDFLHQIAYLLQTFDSPIVSINDQYTNMLPTNAGVNAMHSKTTYINLNGFMANVLGQPMSNQRVKLSNGHLMELSDYIYSDEQLHDIADGIESLHKKQTERGKHFLFIMTPVQASIQEGLLPPGYADTADQNADRLLALLSERNIPFLDTRRTIKEAAISTEEIFYTTDHHWTSQAGFWIYQLILEELREIGAISQINSFYTDSTQFEYRIYEDIFLGSSGKRTGVYFAGTDDFCLIVPKFDTQLHVTIPDWDIDVEGTFLEAAYKENTLLYCECPDLFNENPYGLYGWSDTPCTNWRNSLAPDASKCMLIGDSFGNVPYCLLSLYFSVCDELDMRHYTGDFAAQYTALEPDILILEVNPHTDMTVQTTYPFFPET